MTNQSTEPDLSGILKKLGSMTAIRDTYLAEQSLLRMLGPLLGVLHTSFYRIDDQGTILRALFHSRSVETDKDGVQRVTERIEEVNNDHNVPAEIRGIIDSVRLLGKPCNKKHDGDLLIAYPLFADKELLGYFVFQRDREATPVEDALVHGILEVFTNYYELLDTSQRDQLTGLFNRYSLEINLERLWNLLSTRLHDDNEKETRRDQLPQTYWLCVIDIDHFKKINDRYGHIIGDEVLILVARRLESSLRKSDLLYRYGGEEFIAIIAANDLESASLTFERARRRIDEFKFPQVGHVSISGGFSGADPGVLPQEIINRADSALYAAKDAGRNTIFHYDTLVNKGILKKTAAGSIDLF
jgi:diguanylate cyclase (GGDEF)-like protein